MSDLERNIIHNMTREQLIDNLVAAINASRNMSALHNSDIELSLRCLRCGECVSSTIEGLCIDCEAEE